MALVPTPDRLALTHPQTGITVGVYPSSDPAYDIQLYRAASTKSGAGPTSVPASSKFSELATLGVINGAARVSYVDPLPLSNTLWWYKARSVRTNVATPSAFTTAVVAQVANLPTTAPGAIPFSGKPIQVVPRLTTNATPIYGTTGAPAYYTKTLRFNGADAQPESNTTLWNNTDGNLRCLSTSVQAYSIPFHLPSGAIVTKVVWHVSKGGTSTKSRVTLQLFRGTGSSAVGFGQKDALSSIGSIQAVTLSTFTPVTVSTGTFAWSRMLLNSTTPSGSGATFWWMDVTYKINTLAITI